MNPTQGRVITISWTWIKFRHEIGQKKANNQNLSLFYQLGQKSSTHDLYSGIPDFGRSIGSIVAKLGRNTIEMKTNPSQPVREYFGNFSNFLTPVLHMGVAGATIGTAT